MPVRTVPAVGLFVGSLLALLLIPATASVADVDAHGIVISVTHGSGAGTGPHGGSGGGSGGGTGHRPVYANCQDVSLMVHLLLPITRHFGGTDEVATSDHVAWRSCTRVDSGAAAGWIVGLDLGVGAAAPAPSATELAAAAQSELDLPLPDVSTSPPSGSQQLDGVPVWFWMDHTDPVTATATIPGLSATLTATPTSSRFTISDGTTLRCADLGTPYDPARPSAAQHSDCTHTFDDRGTFTVEATVDWELTWVATDGESGTLPPVAKTSTLDLHVQEGQAVTD